MKQLTDKQEGRLNYLIRKNCYTSEDLAKKCLIDAISIRKLMIQEIIEAHELFNLKEATEKERYSIWRAAFSHQMIRRRNMTASPIRVRQDNKTSINYGTGRGNNHSIRYPKKGRKTAWKRFYRLFPKLDPKNQETD